MTDSRHQQSLDPLARLFPPIEDACTLTVAMKRSDFSASAIARAVEDCDTHLLNLNVTAQHPEDDPDSLLVELRINRRDPAPVMRSLTRHGIDTLSADGADSITPDNDNDSVRQRVNLLLHYLEV